jgi:hypothetical protein
MPKWRKATWGIVVWTGLNLLWLVTGVNAASKIQTGNEYEAAGAAIGTGIGVTIILFIWFFGFIIASIIWFMSRPKNNVLVYGPGGQQVMVSEKEAEKRIAKGWTYKEKR